MKKLILAAMIMAMVLTGSMAFASGGRPKKVDNLNIFGSDDHKSRRTVVTQPNEPVNVPEPASGILLVTGILALIIGGAMEGRKGRER